MTGADLTYIEDLYQKNALSTLSLIKVEYFFFIPIYGIILKMI